MAITKVDVLEGASIKQLPEPLGDSNWTAWRTRILCLLQVCCVKEYIHGTIPRPAADAPKKDVAAWSFNDAYARSIILNNLSDTQLVHARRAGTAKELWDDLALAHWHDAKGEYTAVSVLRRLFRTWAEEGDDIAEHLCKLQKVWECAKESVDGEECGWVCDGQFIGIIAASLPPSWDMFTGSYMAKCKEGKLGPQDFIGVIIEEYRRRRHRGKA